ncbi:molybdopterin molybdotransferase MoeA [Parapedobacter koreensis]|uniref:Molybdopterin molybdenumtransferase n=1 Tax=Parapedobacter koreensis TaxID=332977 RepID=A0A1H7MQ60_9SPHI|nr:gephyrin-like molybdotransferase Glp [Parapedobacter koreensis]SEL13343.1 molybdopterin molybdochelatase [Parapedobacter koreensis]
MSNGKYQSSQIISVAEAKAILNAQAFERKTVRKSLPEAVGQVLAEDVCAQVDVPAFDQSSMDGYAFTFADWKPGVTLAVVGKIPAGASGQLAVGMGEAARIFTGAPLPEGTDTVVMQERTEEISGQLRIDQVDLKQGDHTRTRGAEINRGEVALVQGMPLTAAAIGFLAGVGCDQVVVYALPTVALVITGDELQQPGKPLLHGEVYEASSSMLRAALAQMGIADVQVYYAEDTLEGTIKVLDTALQVSDVVLLTGGVSVGEYDFVVQAASRCGVQQLFHRVRQRPGKPLYAGRKANQPIFGLPGNPSSVLTCFYQYVWPQLRKLTGHNDTLTALRVPLAAAYDKHNQLTHFLKGVYRDGYATILPAQESYRMRTFAVANCLVVLDEAMRHYDANELVDIHLLPSYG